MCRPESAKCDKGAVEKVWRPEVYGEGTWQVFSGRARLVVPGLYGDGNLDRRAEDISKCGAKAGAWEQDGGAFGVLRKAARLQKRFWWAGWYVRIKGKSQTAWHGV
jgi:hypothetical protein